MTVAVREIKIEINGLEFQLLADKGLYWAQQRTLFVADTHFGKEATFRRYGIPVPSGSTAATLNKLSKMLGATSATRLVILGDMFHARSSLSLQVCLAMEEFFGLHNHIRLMLVRGNHDAHVGQLPSAWPVEIIEHQQTFGPIAISHHPMKVPIGSDVLFCGHVHPAIRIRSPCNSIGKLPCFWLSKNCLVFPAVGEFTGTHAIRPTMEDRTWIIVDNRLMEYQLH